MNGALLDDLAARAEKTGPVTIGLAGCGQMGTDIVVQVSMMPHVRIGAISELTPGPAMAAIAMSGRAPEDIVDAKTGGEIDTAIEAGKIAVTDNLDALASAGRIEVVIDATGNPNTGALFAKRVIAEGKHMVMLNVEAEICIGRMLKAEAEAAGVVYTLAAGDEPACTMEIYNFARSLGLEVVAVGKGKNNPLKFDASPAEYEAEAARRDMNPRMLVEFVDGSKTMIEMVAIANATGLVPDVAGMHGPACSREELAAVLCPQSDGGILSKRGCVDYSTGKGVAPGVFCIVAARHERILERLVDLKVGKGPYFTLFRPYHLTSIEVPLSAVRAVLYGRADMTPLDRPVAEAVTLAKSDLGVGDILGQIGDTQYRGWAMTAEEARTTGALPLGLAEGATITAPIKAGESLTYANCRPDSSLAICQLRAELDARDAIDGFTQAAE